MPGPLLPLCCLVVLSLGLAGCRPDEPAVAAKRAAPQDERVRGSAKAPTSEGLQGQKLPKVAFLGDSISAGLHLPADEAFPAVLSTRLRAEGQPFQLVNAGVSGDTTAGGLQRIGWILKQRPDVVVIELGGNDGLRGVSLESIETNLRAIVARVSEAGATPLLLGVRLPTSYGKAYTEGFEALYARVAGDLDVTLVPFFMQGVAGVPEMNLEDGLHPTTQGHRRLADNVAPALKRALERATGS